MLGTIVNSLAIIVGGFMGIMIKKGLKDNYKEIVMQGIGLSVIVIGLMGAFKAQNILLVIISIVIGSLIGEMIGIEKGLNMLGRSLQSRVGGNNSSFSEGFVTTSLIYCVGAMAIVGALESGLTGNHETLFAKSILDGITSVIFASTFGIGVVFSGVSVFIYQGIITIAASSLKELLTDSVITEMSAVGGILIMGIGLNIMDIKKIKIGNMLPSIFIPLVYYGLVILYNCLLG